MPERVASCANRDQSRLSADCCVQYNVLGTAAEILVPLLVRYYRRSRMNTMSQLIHSDLDILGGTPVLSVLGYR